MKLRNKKNGMTYEPSSLIGFTYEDESDCWTAEYPSLAELNEDWEDAQDTIWYITHDGSIHSADIGNSRTREKSIGNYFETREEAEKAVKKLKAWKRLKGKGFRFNNCEIEMSDIAVPKITITAFIDTEQPETLNLVNLLFGGEDETTK